MTIDTSVPADAWEAEGWQPYEPEAFRLYVRDVTGEPTQGGECPSRSASGRPTTILPPSARRCGSSATARAAASSRAKLAAAWLADLNAANQETVWTTDGDDRFSVRARPLLPDEETGLPAAELVSG